MGKLEKIEVERPSIDRVNELDRKIQWNLNRLDNSMQKIVKTLETIKSLDEKSSRIEKIEEVIETLGTTFSSIKTKRMKLWQRRNLSPFKYLRFLELKQTHLLPRELKQ